MPPPLLSRISDYVDQYAERTPAAVALMSDAGSLTYGELAAAIARLAKALLAAGVGRGDRVATLQTPCTDFIVAWMATASIGAIWVGLNPRYQRPELAFVLADAEPAVLLTRTRIEERDFADDLRALLEHAPAIRHVIVFDGDPVLDGMVGMTAFLEAGAVIDDGGLTAARARVAASDPCVIVYTSGSTGVPKGALLLHGAICAFAVEQNRLWPVHPNRSLNFLPINHVGSLCDISMPCLAAGGALHLMERFDPEAATRLIDEAGLTLWGGVPSVLAMQMETEAYRAATMRSVQLIVWEGASMPHGAIERLLEIGPPLATNYSMTESVSSITALPPTRDLDVLAETVGSDFPGVEVRLIDELGREVDRGAPGEVAIASPYLFGGYWRRPDETAACFTKDGFFRTGDLAIRRADGQLRLVGRLKEMFKSGGYNVYPREIERVLEDHPAVDQAAVVAVADPEWQEVGAAFVVTRDGLSAADLRAWCMDRLANYKRPKHFFVRSKLPLLPIGKVDKRALSRSATQLVQAASAREPPKNMVRLGRTLPGNPGHGAGR